MTKNKSNQSHGIKTKRWTKFVSKVSHLSDNYLFTKTIIYSRGKPKLNFIRSKSQHQRKQEKGI